MLTQCIYTVPLIISGGADVRYEIELEDDGPSFFSTIRPTSRFVRSELKEGDIRVLEELVTAEIIVPVLFKKGSALRVGVLGDKNSLAFAFHQDLRTVDLLLIVRVNSTYAVSSSLFPEHHSSTSLLDISLPLS